jgi:hypothetical protein
MPSSSLSLFWLVILRFDTKDRVRHRVVNLKNRVLGNTQKYEEEPIVASLFRSVPATGAVNNEHVVFCTVSNLQQDETYVGYGKCTHLARKGLEDCSDEITTQDQQVPLHKD